MDGLGVYYAKRGKSDREKQTLYDITKKIFFNVESKN